MEPRNESPESLRNEHDDLTQSLPVEEQKESSSEKDTKKSEWQRRLGEELSAGREEKDFTD